MNARWQLNGLVVLYAYLQRIFVYDKVLATIAAKSPVPPPFPELPALLDKTGTALRGFDSQAGLSGPDIPEFEAVLAHVRQAMSDRAAHPEAPLRDRLAALAGDRFHRRHLLDGLVHWGNRYNPTAADRYLQQIPAARGAADELTRLVSSAANNTLTAENHTQIDTWYAEVVGTTPRITTDLTMTTRLLHGRPPA